MIEFKKLVRIEAVQLQQDVNGFAYAGDWLLIGDDGSQVFMNQDEFLEYTKDYEDSK